MGGGGGGGGGGRLSFSQNLVLPRPKWLKNVSIIHKVERSFIHFVPYGL